jgi:hypothetical protein
MSIRWTVIGLNFFAIATLTGLGFALLGPIHLVRMLGLVAAACGGAGMLLHATALHRANPGRLVRWRQRLATRTGASARRSDMRVSGATAHNAATA